MRDIAAPAGEQPILVGAQAPDGCIDQYTAVFAAEQGVAKLSGLQHSQIARLQPLQTFARLRPRECPPSHEREIEQTDAVSGREVLVHRRRKSHGNRTSAWQFRLLDASFVEKPAQHGDLQSAARRESGACERRQPPSSPTSRADGLPQLPNPCSADAIA